MIHDILTETETNRARLKKWRNEHKEQYLANQKRYRKLERVQEKRRIYLDKVRGKVNEWGRNSARKRRSTPEGRLMDNSKRMVSRSLAGIKNNRRTRDLLGYSSKELAEHLQNLFTAEMSWENYGEYWELDHIIPISSFSMTKIEQFNECWKLSNLRPLKKHINRVKYNRIGYACE